MASKVPNSVRVLSHRYTVLSSESVGKSLRQDDAHGDVDTDDLVIRVDASRPPDLVAHTLLHEILHALFAMTPLCHAMSHAKQEQLVTTLSPLLFDTLRQNPEVLDFIAGKNA